MAKENVLDETKNVLEMMSESEEKVSFLRKDLSQNKSLCQQIRDNLKELRELNNKNTAELEDNQHLKNNIKRFNKHLLTFAQQIYSSTQELYSDLNTHDNELVKLEESLNKSNKIFEDKSNQCKIMVNTLKKELDLLEIKGMENTTRKELEDQALAAEYGELQMETKMIDEKIDQLDKYIKSEVKIFDAEKNIEKTIEELQESVKFKESEIDGFLTLLNEAKQNREKLEKDRKAVLLELELQIEESKIVVQEIASNSESCEQNISEVSRNLEILEENNRNKEGECSNYEDNLNNIEINLKILEEDNTKVISQCEKSFLINEGMCKQEEEIGEHIKLDICAIKKNMELQHEIVEKISKFLTQKKETDNDLNAELEAMENERQELKITHKKLKEDYDKRIQELEGELKRCQEEIEVREETNRKLQEDTDSLISELEGLKDQAEKLTIEKEWQTKKMSEIDGQVNDLNLKLAQVKTEKTKTKKKTADYKVLTSQESSTSSKDKKVRPRHWDSDSSIEEEGRIISQMIKQKIKMKKLGRGKTHSK